MEVGQCGLLGEMGQAGEGVDNDSPHVSAEGTAKAVTENVSGPVILLDGGGDLMN